MHLTQSLVNGTLDAAVQALADRAVALRHGAPRIEKAALDKTAFLQNIAPAHQSALIGAGVGGALGLGNALMQDPEDRRTGSNMLTGAIAGGATGLGLGLVAQNNPAKALAPSTDAQGRPALGKGQFYHPSTGKPMAMSDNLPPEVAARITNLNEQASGSSVPNKTLNVAGTGIWNTLTGAPVTTAATTGVIAKNMASRDGKTVKALGGKDNWLTKLVSPGGWGLNKVESQNAGHLQSGLSEALKAKDVHGFTPDQAKAMQHFENQAAIDPKLYKTVAGGSGDWLSEPKAGVSEHKLDRATLKRLAGMGVDAQMPKTMQELGRQPTLRTSLLHRLTGGRVGSPHVNMAARGAKARTIGKYGAGLGLSLLGERFLRDSWNQYSAGNEVQKLLEQYAKPIAE